MKNDIKTVGKVQGTNATPQDIKLKEVVKIETPKEDKQQTPVIKMEQEAKAPATVQEILEKMATLNRLTEKRDRIFKTKKQLENFKLSGDDLTTALLLEDANGERFQSNHSGFISEVLQLLNAKVQD
jgi:hypothetical protein